MLATDKLEMIVQVKGGKLDLADAAKARIAGFLAHREGKPVVLRLAKVTDTRSQRQNRYYWGACLTTIAEATGNSTEDLHEVFKGRFLPRKFVTLAGKEIEVERTTTKLSTAEFARYIEQIAAFAASELGITIPESP